MEDSTLQKKEEKKLEEKIEEKKEKRVCQTPWSAVPSSTAFSFSLSDQDKKRRGY
ncbi:MAG: hypothetical protein Q7R92_03385 [bacterium]|nr:hypothetical protein [bacterium]